MTLQTLKRDLAELKEAIKPDLWGFNSSITDLEALKVKEEIVREIEESKTAMQRYIDAGVFDDEEGKEDNSINMNWESCNIPTLTVDLIQRWKNRGNLRIEEKTQLYRDIGFFT